MEHQIQVEQTATCVCAFIPDEHQLKHWIEAALPEDSSFSLDVRLVDSDEMKMLNQQYRKKDKVTDILSFPFTPPEHLTTPFLGDIVLCPEKINHDANENHIPLNERWGHLLVHGTLHLLGYDHENDEEANKMAEQEIKILEKLAIPNPYEKPNE